MPNVFIFPTTDRSGQASLIDHYNRSGWNVYVPQYGTLGLRWDAAATWPALLSKSSSGMMNLEIHGFERDESLFFGEDFFLNDFTKNASNMTPTCEIIDLEKSVVEFDVYHTLRGGESHQDFYRQVVSKYMKKAKWISSSVNPWDGAVGNPENLALFVPAAYSKSYDQKNCCKIVATDIEFSLLNVQKIQKRDPVVASFNHNFAVRQPQDYDLFVKMNEVLTSKGFTPVINYGGNVRGLGADVRYSKAGPTGKFETLSPREALKKTSSLSAVLHLKQNDWGGGVFYYAMNCHTPIITTRRYVTASGSENQIIDGYNAVLADTPESLADAVIRITTDEEYMNKLSMGMKEISQRVDTGCGWKTEEYWKSWNLMLEKTLSA